MCDCNCSGDFFSTIGNIFVCVGVFVAIWQFKADHNRRKKQSTIEFYNNMSSENKAFIDRLDEEQIKKTALDYKYVKGNKELYDCVTWYLSRLERLSVGVAAGIFDIVILNNMSGAYLIDKYNQLKTYIREERIHDNAPKRYDEFEKLVKRIKKYRKKQCRKE